MLALLLAAAVAAASAGQNDPQQLAAVLKSAAPPAEKAIACKRLAIYGTKDSVPALAPLLADEKLASWARIALEAIPDPAADDALRNAISQLHGKLLIGVINSIGVRRDAKSITVLTAKLQDSNSEVASAAAVALGHIGGPAVAATLTSLLGTLRPAAAEGCLLCAETLPPGAAAKLYDAVRAANVSKQKTLEATRGAILARQADGIPLLVEQLRSQDRAFFNIALRTAREIPDRTVGKVLLAELERAPVDRQPALLLTLADRGDAETLGIALKLAGHGQRDTRVIALNVLERLENPAAIPVLLGAASEDDAELSQAAKTALLRLPAAEVDVAAVAWLNKPEDNLRRTAIELIGLRRVTSAVPALMQIAAATNASLSAVSLHVLGDLAGAGEIPALINILLKAQNPAAAANALSAVCARQNRPVSGNVVIRKAEYGVLPAGPSANVTAKVAELVKTGTLAIEASNNHFGDPAGGHVKQLRVEFTVNGIPTTRTVNENETLTFAVSAPPAAVVDPLCAAVNRAAPDAKQALIRILRSAGGPKALAAVRTAAADSNAAVKEAALRMLCDWPTPDALPDLVQLAQTTPDRKFKILSLRGQFRLIPLQEVPPAQKLADLKKAMALIERHEEKRLALAALGEIPTADSLALVTPYLTTDGLSEEAAIAAVAIAEKIVGQHPAEVFAAMKQVNTANKKLANRARHLQAQARPAALQK